LPLRRRFVTPAVVRHQLPDALGVVGGLLLRRDLQKLVDLVPLAKSLGEPTTIERHWALLIATFSRFGFSGKLSARGASSALLAVSE